MAVEMKVKDSGIKDESGALKLSASSIKTYDQCPLKYFYNYISKEKKKHWAHFDLGNLCHKTLEIFHQMYIDKGTNKQSLAKLMESSFKSARKEFNKLDNEIVLEAKNLIKDYLKKVSKNMPLVKGVETSFNFHIDAKIIVRGILDRTDILKSGTFHIIDYKTTKNTKYLDPFQLLMYGMWLKKEYPHINEFKASYILLRHKSKLKSYNFNIEDLKACEKKVFRYAAQINDSIERDVWPPIPGPLCNWCDFKSICPTQESW